MSASASSDSSALAAANELFVAEDYVSAAPLYDAAVAQQPNSPATLIARAANNIKLKQYTAALRDADAALAVEGASSLALYRRGSALFYLDDFASALAAFQQAEQLGSKQSALFIRKCEAELQRTKQTNSSAAASAPASVPAPAQAAAATAEVAAVSAPPPASSASSGTGSSGSGQGSSLVAPLSSRVNESWFQRRDSVTITLFAKGLTSSAVSASVDPSSPEQLTARLQLPDGSVFEKRWSLFADVQPDGLKVDVTAYRVELIAAKAVEEEWLGLLDTDRKKAAGLVKRDNVVRAEAEAVSSYPTSSRKKVEWSEVESAAVKQEEEEKPQGDAALQKLFQTIYKDASEDTRRAMIKSFQTSGGTVLSTNWKEVKDTDYTKNKEAPSGMQFQDWNNPST